MSLEAVSAGSSLIVPKAGRLPIFGRTFDASALAFAVWCAGVLWLSFHHTVWRDEVRALSLAIDPPNLWAMVDGLRGEGHPILWYLLLRTAHGVISSPYVLQVASVLAAAAAMAFLFRRAPFPLYLKLLIAASAFVVFDYAVISRNYGIAMLPLFMFADRYDDWRDRGIGLGLLLFIVANTSVHAALVVIALCGMWLVDVLSENGFGRSKALRTFALNALVAALGVVLAAALTVGPANDTYSSEIGQRRFAEILASLLNCGVEFRSLAPAFPAWLLTALLLGCLLTLTDRLALWLAGLGALALTSLFFATVYPGNYRHAAIWIVLLLSLLWISERRRRAEKTTATGYARRIGAACLLVLLACQVGATVRTLVALIEQPRSAGRALAGFLLADPRLVKAIVIGEPDVIVEPLRYYGMDRTWLMRQGRFGHVVNLTRNAQLMLSLADILGTAERLAREHGSEVVMVFQPSKIRLDPSAPATVVRHDEYWSLTLDPADVAEFLARTERLGIFDKTGTDEAYVAYRLR